MNLLFLRSLILGLIIASAEVVERCYPSSPTLEDVDADSNGGYGGGHVPEMLAEQCDINTVDALYDSPDYILRQCQNVPCRIRNAVPTSWKEAWSFANLTGAYGEIQVKGNTIAHQRGDMLNLGNYSKNWLFPQTGLERLEKPVPKIWDGLDQFSGLGDRLRKSDIKWAYHEGELWDEYRTGIAWHPLHDRVVPPAIAAHYTKPGIRPEAEAFVAGGPCAGTFVHEHGPAIATLVHGMKRWAFVRSGTELGGMFKPSTYGDTGLEFWDQLVPPNLQQIPTNASSMYTGKPHPVLLCTQKAGDAIFTPGFWQHATLNIWSSLASVTEFNIEDSIEFNYSMNAEVYTDAAAEDMQMLYSKVWETYGHTEYSGHYYSRSRHDL